MDEVVEPPGVVLVDVVAAFLRAGIGSAATVERMAVAGDNVAVVAVGSAAVAPAQAATRTVPQLSRSRTLQHCWQAHELARSR